jgi:hypothetical protein
MTKTFNTDGSAVVPLDGFYDTAAWREIEFSHYADDGVTPIPLNGEWKMKIFTPSGYPSEAAFTIEQGAGIDITDHVLTFQKPDDLFIPGGIYQYMILNREDDKVFIVYSGSLTVNKTADLWP